MRYKIFKDNYLGYEVRVRRWYWPFWVMPFINTCVSIRQAEVLINVLKSTTKKTKDNGRKES